MRQYFNLDQNNQFIAQPLANPAGAVANANIQPQAGQNNLSVRIQALMSWAGRVQREGVVIPTGPGLHLDIASVFIAIVGSLFPQWTPTGAPVLQWD